MKIEHLAIWVNNLEVMKDFYTRYFEMQSGARYTNPAKKFSSYFLSSTGEGSARIELMHKAGGDTAQRSEEVNLGFAHFAVSVGSKEQVEQLTETLRADGYTIAGEPRTTGDGYFESVVCDPEGNRIEITI